MSPLSDAAYMVGIEDILKRRSQEDSEMVKTVRIKIPAQSYQGKETRPAYETDVLVEVDMEGIARMYGERAVGNMSKVATVCHGLVKVTSTGGRSL